MVFPTHQPNRMLITGGAGFIGVNFATLVLNECPDVLLLNIDALTYAGTTRHVDALSAAFPGRHRFVRADIRNAEIIDLLFQEFQPDTVVNFAAESHVDRSIDGPLDFVKTNVLGTAIMLETARKHWKNRHDVRFHQISTDEVYGSLGQDGLFSENSQYDPSSPYSASKAAADHLVSAWHRTYGMPVTISNCSNNYGPWQFPEKLIPLMIANALAEKELPVYGKGANVRDWLHVEDHARAIWTIITMGQPGCTYMVGGNNQYTNLELVQLLCRLLDERKPRASGTYCDLVTFVTDRPGHDARYAVDCSKLRNELGWEPRWRFEPGLANTIDWYIKNQDWVEEIHQSSYNGGRLGLNQSAAKA